MLEHRFAVLRIRGQHILTCHRVGVFHRHGLARRDTFSKLDRLNLARRIRRRGQVIGHHDVVHRHIAGVGHRDQVLDRFADSVARTLSTGGLRSQRLVDCETRSRLVGSGVRLTLAGHLSAILGLSIRRRDIGDRALEDILLRHEVIVREGRHLANRQRIEDHDLGTIGCAASQIEDRRLGRLNLDRLGNRFADHDVAYDHVVQLAAALVGDHHVEADDVTQGSLVAVLQRVIRIQNLSGLLNINTGDSGFFRILIRLLVRIVRIRISSGARTLGDLSVVRNRHFETLLIEFTLRQNGSREADRLLRIRFYDTSIPRDHMILRIVAEASSSQGSIVLLSQLQLRRQSIRHHNFSRLTIAGIAHRERIRDAFASKNILLVRFLLHGELRIRCIALILAFAFRLLSVDRITRSMHPVVNLIVLEVRIPHHITRFDGNDLANLKLFDCDSGSIHRIPVADCLSLVALDLPNLHSAFTVILPFFAILILELIVNDNIGIRYITSISHGNLIDDRLAQLNLAVRIQRFATGGNRRLLDFQSPIDVRRFNFIFVYEFLATAELSRHAVGIRAFQDIGRVDHVNRSNRNRCTRLDILNLIFLDLLI